MKSIVRFFRKFIASLGGVGYLSASGTFASAITVAALWFGRDKLAAHHIVTTNLHYWLLVIAVTSVSIFFASKSKELFGKDDSGRIVIDEVAGQLVTFIFIPLSFTTLIAGFALFRFFDIVKPSPVYQMEEIEGGVGVTMDDVVAVRPLNRVVTGKTIDTCRQ